IMQVVVDSILTHYVRGGEGNVVVIVHGWADSSAGLHNLGAALSHHYDVIALDLPGFGKTDTPGNAWGLNEYAAFVGNFLKKIGVRQVWAFIGHSNGGAIVMRGVAQGRLEADRVVLLASAGIRNVYKGRTRALRLMAKTGKVFTAPLSASIKKKIRRKVYKTVGSDMLVAEHMQETFKRIISDDVRQDAAQLTQPVLLLYGEDDESTPIWYGEQFHELMANSTLEILPGAGHFVHLDRRKDVEDAILRFLG
ncbi:MAG TPA: alpha/beta hydrolase, partial [Candidatus Saccharimonadales bacterium]|nr:alpha/beta hydrolase [Candidatus Saccharimonadales bacterium]